MRPVLTLLHGWGYTPRVWGPLIPCLSGFECHTPATEAPCTNIEDWADALAPTLPADGLLAGWSLGAMLALCLATRHPEKVSGLLLIGITPRMERQANWAHGLDSDTIHKFRTGFTQSPARLMRRFLALQLLGEKQPARLRPLLEASLCQKATPETLGAGLEVLFSADLRQTHLPDGLPVQILHGQGDAIMPVAGAQWLASHLGGARLSVVEDCGHAPWLAQPEHIAERIKTLHAAH